MISLDLGGPIVLTRVMSASDRPAPIIPPDPPPPPDREVPSPAPEERSRKSRHPSRPDLGDRREIPRRNTPPAIIGRASSEAIRDSGMVVLDYR